MNPSANLAERLRAITESPAYRLAYEDIDLLGQDELRPLRLQLELLKPERILRFDENWPPYVAEWDRRATTSRRSALRRSSAFRAANW